MARGRMIAKCLSTSECRAALHPVAGPLAEFCQALFDLLVAHADDFGRQPGSVFHVKHAVEPTSPRPEADFKIALKHLHAVGLIDWYEVEGQKFIYINKFEEHQHLSKKAKKSLFPESPGVPGKSRRSPAKSGKPRPIEEKRTELNLTEQKGREEDPSAPDGAFENFWKQFPRKEEKQNALKAFRKLSPDVELLARILVALDTQKREYQRTHPPNDNWKYFKYGASWLNAKRWEDESPDPQAAVDPTDEAWDRVLGKVGAHGNRH